MLKILINADDFGFTHDTNEAVRILFEKDVIRSTSVMFNMPAAIEAKELRSSYPDAGIGVHLNLTQGKPLVDHRKIPSLVGTDHNFLPFKKLCKNMMLHKIPKEQLKMEIEAQFEYSMETLNGMVDHWDSHQGIHRFEPVFSIATSEARKMGIKGMRIHQHWFVKNGSAKPLKLRDGFPHSVKRIIKETYYRNLMTRARRFFKTPDGILAWIGRDTCQILKRLFELKWDSGTVLEMPCHPAVSTEGLFGTTLTEKRVDEFKTLMSDDFFFGVKSGLTEICSYKSLQEKS